MAGEKRPETPPPDGPEGHNGLADTAKEATREIEKRRDGSEGYGGEGDIG